MTEYTATPGDGIGEVTITRDFDAPRELMFRCFVEPEHFVKFWGPTGTHVPIETVVIEPWAGGRFESTMVMDDGSGEFPMKAVFVEVTEPEVFAFKEPESNMISTSTFTDLGDGRTRLVIHQTNVPAYFRTKEDLEGFNTSLDRFEAYLERAPVSVGGSNAATRMRRRSACDDPSDGSTSGRCRPAGRPARDRAALDGPPVPRARSQDCGPLLTEVDRPAARSRRRSRTRPSPG